MSDGLLYGLADAVGLIVDWRDAAGRMQHVSPDVLRHALGVLGFPADNDVSLHESLQRARGSRGPSPLTIVDVGLPIDTQGAPGAPFRLWDERGRSFEGRLDGAGKVSGIDDFGYYLLEYAQETVPLAVTPRRCFTLNDLTGERDPRRWGVALQVYSARGALDGGIGDAEAALHWAEQIAQGGGDAVALSPLHASRALEKHYSPYYPSDRRFFDPLYASPALVLGVREANAALLDAGIAEEFDMLHNRTLIEWPRSARAKWTWLQQLHRRFSEAPIPLKEDFAQFSQEGGEVLERFVQFTAADAQGRIEGDADLQRFAQWLTTRSWALAQQKARESGMALGLIADLAVGFDPLGAEASAWADAIVPQMVLGAPPDAFNPHGQAWGLGAYAPEGLQRTGYAPFIELLQAVMRDRGGVRIDHILGFLRIWLVPEGADASQGVYLRYPVQQMLRLLALESWRQRVVVIGEDLGVVPDGFRKQLSAWGILGIEVLLFARGRRGAFLPLNRWRRDAMAMTTTHDLPTLEGWRRGVDLQWRQRLGIAGESQEARQSDVEQLSQRVSATLGGQGDTTQDWLRFVSSSASPLALMPAEDALGVQDQPNFPGTIQEYPNWRRRLPESIETPLWQRNTAAFASGRSREKP